MTTSDPPVQIQAPRPERDAYLVTEGSQSGSAAQPEPEAEASQ